MTSIKDAIKNFEAREAKKAAEAGLPEPPKAPDAERVMLYVLLSTHSIQRFRPFIDTLQVWPAATHSKNGQYSGHS